MTARDDYPITWAQCRPNEHTFASKWEDEMRAMLAEIDLLRFELDRCEQRNETLRKHCDDAVNEVQRYRTVIRQNRSMR